MNGKQAPRVAVRRRTHTQADVTSAHSPAVESDGPVNPPTDGAQPNTADYAVLIQFPDVTPAPKANACRENESSSLANSLSTPSAVASADECEPSQPPASASDFSAPEPHTVEDSNAAPTSSTPDVATETVDRTEMLAPAATPSSAEEGRVDEGMDLGDDRTFGESTGRETRKVSADRPRVARHQEATWFERHGKFATGVAVLMVTAIALFMIKNNQNNQTVEADPESAILLSNEDIFSEPIGEEVAVSDGATTLQPPSTAQLAELEAQSSGQQTPVARVSWNERPQTKADSQIEVAPPQDGYAAIQARFQQMQSNNASSNTSANSFQVESSSSSQTRLPRFPDLSKSSSQQPTSTLPRYPLDPEEKAKQ